MRRPSIVTARLGAALVVVTLAAGALTACSGDSREAAAEGSAAPAPAGASVGASAAPAAESVGASAAPAAASDAGVSSASPAPASAVQGNSGELPVAAIVAFAVVPNMNSLTAMRGQFMPMSQYAALFSVIGCEFDCTADKFAVPTATGPWTQLPSGPDKVIWGMAYRGEYAADRPSHVYPGEVYFTAASGITDIRLKEKGFTGLNFGAQLGDGIRSFLTPASWPVNDKPFIGSLHLFAPGAKAQPNLIPADGRTVPATSKLGELLANYGFPVQSGKVAVPTLAPVDGYTWSITSDGRYPSGW